MTRPCPALALLLALALPAAAQETQTLVLKDGRRIPVTRLARRDGQVILRTTRGEVFSVPEDQVVSPPLESIPAADAPLEPSRPVSDEGPRLLELKDGRKIPVTRLARRGGKVLFQTTRGESFSVPEDEVVSPPLETIPSLAAPVQPGAAPEPTPPEPVSPEAPTQPEAPPPPPQPAQPPEPRGPLPGFEPFRDRWSVPFPSDPRIVEGRLIDPYNQNVLKGDRPVIGDSVFLVLTGTLDVPSELRRLPVPGGVSTADPSTFEFFGRGEQFFTTPRGFLSLELFKGQTAFKPKKWAVKLTGAFNVNYLRVRERNLVNVDVREDITRRREHFSLEEAFLEWEPFALSPYYDSLSLRVGIQPFVSDFRGLIFSDFNLGARVFGDLGSNRWQFNAAYFDLLEKETNSELNITSGLWDADERRGQQLFIANVFRQDTFALGYTLSGSLHVSRDEADVHFDENGFLVRPAALGVPRPHAVDSNYLGLAGDGHIGRLNLSHALYYAFGEDELNVVAGKPVDIRAWLGALEASVDRDWARFKASLLFASGDSDVGDDRAGGFDTLYDNSNFAGGPFSFWSRSAIALTQTKVLLKPPLTLLPSLRSNKFEGQASFVNPGLLLAGLGVDLDLTPKLRTSLVANYLRFHRTQSLEALLFQPRIGESIGLDLGLGFLYRPLLNENVLLRGGVTGLIPGNGFEAIYSSDPCAAPDCGAPSRQLFNAFLELRLSY